MEGQEGLYLLPKSCVNFLPKATRMYFSAKCGESAERGEVRGNKLKRICGSTVFEIPLVSIQVLINESQ